MAFKVFTKLISGILLIINPATATASVIIVKLIKEEITSSFLISLMALTINFIAYAKATNIIAIPIPVKN